MRAREFTKKIKSEDYDPNGPPPGPEFKPTMPKGTVKVDVSDVYDWYKLGQHISNLKGLGKHDFGKGPPSTILSFGDEDTEHKYIGDLEKTGLTTTDIDPVDPNQPKGMKRQKVDPTYNINEIETIPGREYNPKAKEFFLWPEDAAHYKQTMKPLPGGSGLTYVTNSRQYNRSIVILDPSNLNYFVGELKLERANTIPDNTWQASLISVHPKYRGQGIAKALYGLALLPKPEGQGITLISDSLQTPGGVRNWASLSQIPGVEVTGLVAVQKVDLKKLAQSPETQARYEKLMTDLLGEVGGFYYSENMYYYFYQIPVKVVGSNLENTIKKSLIKIYPKDFIMHHHTLLMAQYDGADNVDEAKKRKRKGNRTPRSITTGWWGGYYGDNSSGGDGGGGE